METKYLPIRAKLPPEFTEEEKDTATLLLVELAQICLEMEEVE